jgi:tRNA G10  N-methylase Trm11
MCMLGRQPELGLAELESRFGADAVRQVSDDTALLETGDEFPDFDRFGSVLKAAQLLAEIDSADWNKTIRFIQKSLPAHIEDIPEGKITLGLSAHGVNATPQQVNAAALSLKKLIKQQAGRSVRIVPNAEPSLNTAQVIHNKLTAPNGIELLVVGSGKRTLLAQTFWVQDIEAYRRRDQERPMRDARVGMLPPKLAQIIINLALGPVESPGADHDASLENNEPQKAAEIDLLDPFCGTGVLLQEAALMGLTAIGSDIDPRMVEYSIKNMEWLKQAFSPEKLPEVHVADATSAAWKPMPKTIACETYLGRALSSLPDQETLQKIIKDCDTIHSKFLRNIARQTGPGYRMCIAVPAWHVKSGIKRLPVLDHLEELGYNRVSFVHANTSDLVYHRENQIVGRELVVVTRK